MDRPNPPTPRGHLGRPVLWLVPLLALDLGMPALSARLGWPRTATLVVQLACLVMMGRILWMVWRAAREQLRRGP